MLAALLLLVLLLVQLRVDNSLVQLFGTTLHRVQLVSMSGGGWREHARECVLHDEQAFIVEDGLTWLAAAQHDELLPLASMAECGHAECACTRFVHPRVRRRFREEVVRRAHAARDRGAVPSQLRYIGVGSGLLLGDLDVLMGLQAAGFTIEMAIFIDTDYLEHCHGALREMELYLEPARVVAFASAPDYLAARFNGALPSAHLFLQIDCDELSVGEAAALSAVALDDAGGGLGFRLANRHHPAFVPMVSWQRSQSIERPLVPDLCRRLQHASHQAPEATEASRATVGEIEYASLLSGFDPTAYLAIDKEPVPLDGSSEPTPLLTTPHSVSTSMGAAELEGGTST